jgi:hypothetical protein
LFVERDTPVLVPAKRVVPLAAKEYIVPPKGPFVCTHCATPIPVNREDSIRIRNTLLKLTMGFHLSRLLV